MMQPSIAIIVPCLNEEECISDTSNRLLSILDGLVTEGEISDNSFILYIDDGSSDNTWNLIVEYNQKTNGKVKGIKFSRNFGNQKALLAGILECKKYNPDCCISIDADLQQDEFKIKEFVQKYKNGAQMVLGIRNDRHTDSFFKKFTALAFYKLMNILGVGIKVNHSDYRLISSQVIEALSNYKETNLFLRGMFSELGFKKEIVYFDVKPREKGNSKYSPFQLLSLALRGITSFSIVPLRMVSVLGFIMSAASFLVGLSALIEKIRGVSTVPGWATIVVAIGFIGGIQILCIGVLGEYLGQLFQEVKARPRYIIEQEIN